MIVIKDQDFEMVQYKNLPFFDLKMPVKVNEGKANERTELKIVGYGMPFHTCLQQIISHRLNDSEAEYSIQEYIQVYAEEVKKLEKLVQYVEKPTKKKTKSEEDEDDEDEDNEELDTMNE